MSDGTPTSVYLYYDAYDVLVYVGITSRGIGRNHEHNRSKSWWKHVARQEVEHFPDRDTAHAREVALIERYTPPFNTQHNQEHAAMRAAYESVTQRAIGSDPLELARSLGKSIPLTILERGQNLHILRTHAEHSIIATRMHLREAKQAKVIAGEERIGHIRKVETRGPFALIHVTIRTGYEAFSASADLNIITGKTTTFPVRRIRLTAV